MSYLLKAKKILFCNIAILLLFTGCTKAPTGKASKNVKLQYLTEYNPPMSFLLKKKPAGMAVDVVKALSEKLGLVPKIKIQQWYESYATALHNPNVILFPTVRNKQREARFYWLGPIMHFTYSFYAKRHSKIKINTLSDTKKYKIATIRGFCSEEYLINKGFKDLYRCSTPMEALEALMSNKVQLIVLNNVCLEILLHKTGHSMADVIPVYKLDSGDFYIAISKRTPEAIVEEWQNAFKTIKRDRTYYKIYRKWFMSSKLSLYD